MYLPTVELSHVDAMPSCQRGTRAAALAISHDAALNCRIFHLVDLAHEFRHNSPCFVACTAIRIGQCTSHDTVEFGRVRRSARTTAGAEDELVARGQWRPLPGKKSFVPHSRHSYVCVDCYAESTCYPCACCEGRQAPGHAMVLSGAGGVG